MAYTKKMVLQALSIMNMVGFVSFASAMDKVPATRSKQEWDKTAPAILAAANKQEKDDKDHPIAQDTQPLQRFVKQSGGVVVPLVNNQDSRDFASAQKELRAKVQKEEAARQALLEKKQEQENKKKAVTVLAQQQSDQRQKELSPYFDQFEGDGFFVVETEKSQSSCRTSHKTSRRTSHKNPNNPVVPVGTNPVVLPQPQNDFGFEGNDAFVMPRGKLLSDVPGAPLKAANKDKMEPKKKNFDLSLSDNLFGSLSSVPSSPEKMALDISYDQFDNGFANLTPPGSPKKVDPGFSTARPANTRKAHEKDSSRQEKRTDATLANAQHSQGTVDYQYIKAFKPAPVLQINFSDEDN